MSESVKVVVRCRPMNSKENRKKCKSIVEIDTNLLQVCLSKPSSDPYEEAAEPKAFTFDAVYDDRSTQREVFDETACPLVESVLAGYNGTIFAYGQTGCGKTFTMNGIEKGELKGIIPRAFDLIFEQIALNQNTENQFLVRASYIEIYNEEVRDLLGKDPKQGLTVSEDKEKGVKVLGLSENVVKDSAKIQELMDRGTRNRTVGFTAMNADSSRSHSIFTIHIETSVPDEVSGKPKIKAGKLNLVDLAGSERQSKTAAEGIRLREAAKINLSLSALGNVISALVSGKSSHVPYRDSKLTRLLQDSLGGNTKTIMIAAISPADYNYDETLSTLRYANRAKNIKNKPKVNEDPKDALLREYQEEIQRLKSLLSKSGHQVGQTAAAVSHWSKQLHVKGDNVTVVDDAALAKAEEKISDELSHSKHDAEKLAAEKEQSDALARQLEEAIEQERKERERLKGQLQEQSEQARFLEQERERRERELKERLEEEKQRASSINDRMAQEIERQKQLAEQLEERQRQAENEKVSLQEKMEVLQSQLLTGQQLQDENAKIQDRLRKAALKIKHEKQKQAQMREEQAKKEEERLLLEEKYSSVQEEATAVKQKLTKLFKRFKASQQENEDLQQEFEKDREGYLESIRDSVRQGALYKQLLRVFMSSTDIEKAARLAEWNDDLDEWELPTLANAPTRVMALTMKKQRRSRRSTTNDRLHINTELLSTGSRPASPNRRLVPLAGGHPPSPPKSARSSRGELAEYQRSVAEYDPHSAHISSLAHRRRTREGVRSCVADLIPSSADRISPSEALSRPRSPRPSAAEVAILRGDSPYSEAGGALGRTRPPKAPVTPLYGRSHGRQGSASVTPNPLTPHTPHTPSPPSPSFLNSLPTPDRPVFRPVSSEGVVAPNPVYAQTQSGIDIADLPEISKPRFQPNPVAHHPTPTGLYDINNLPVVNKVPFST